MTPEQQELLHEYLDKWKDIFLDTSPLDMEKLRSASELYVRKLKRGPVNKLSVYKSPLTACIAAKLYILNQYHEETGITFYDLMDSKVPVTKKEYNRYYPLLVMSEDTFFQGMEDITQLNEKDKFRWKVLDSWLRNEGVVHAVSGFGNHTGIWLAYLEYFYDHMGYKEELEPFFAHIAMAKASGWVWVVDNNLFVSERPTQIHFNEDNELSNLEGPSVEWGDKLSYYSIEGITVPKYIIENPASITVQAINDTFDVDIKRFMMNLYQGGVSKYLEDSSAKLLDIDTIPINVWGTGVYTRALYDIGLPNPLLVATDGSTGTVYYLNADEGVTTCSQAHNSISPVDEDNILASS